MDDLVRWLVAQLDEDERIARAATDGPWTPWRGQALHGLGDLIHPVLMPGQKPGSKAVIVTASWLDAEHIAEWDPARVLREIDAKRRIIERYERAMDNKRAHPDDLASAGALLALHGAVKLLALPYSDRPGYQEGWAP